MDLVTQLMTASMLGMAAGAATMVATWRNGRRKRSRFVLPADERTVPAASGTGTRELWLPPHPRLGGLYPRGMHVPAVHPCRGALHMRHYGLPVASDAVRREG